MKRRRTIVTGRSPISDAEISQLRPAFSALHEQIHPPPIQEWRSLHAARRRVLWVLSSVAAVTIFFLVWQLFMLKTPHDNGIFDPSILAQPLQGRPVAPPEPELLAFESFNVHPELGGVLITRKGSRITIPPYAFAFSDGTPCREVVEVKFSEYHNVVEIFLSGIPMHYDSAGVTWTFESAGMFDISAYSSGQSLVIADSKEIGIELVSNATDIYNFYHFDTVANSWVYLYTESPTDIRAIAPSEARPVPQPSVAIAPEQEAPKSDPQPDIRAIAPSVARPVVQSSIAIAPEQEAPKSVPQITRSPGTEYELVMRPRDPRSFAFRVDFDEAQFPELAGLDNLMFEVPAGSEATRYLSGRWDNMSLARISGEEYEITLFRNQGRLTFNARPVLDDSAWLSAIEAFTASEANRQVLAQESQRITRVTEQGNRQLAATAMEQWAFSRGATIRNLGKYNWDVPMPEPHHAIAGKGNFVDEKGTPLAPKELFIAQKGVNILWSYLPSQPWKYSKSQENILWFMLPGGKYAIVDDTSLREGKRNVTARVVSRDEALQEISTYI